MLRRTAAGLRILSLLFLMGAVSCAADSRSASSGSPVSTEEKAMTIYPKIYADFRHTSSQGQSAAIAGRQLWFTAAGGGLPAEPPSVLLVTEDGLTAQYGDQLVRIAFDGKVAWSEARNKNMNIVAAGRNVYYRGRDGYLHGIDPSRKQLLTDFNIPNCFDRGGVAMVYPVDDSHFIIQTYNRAREVKEDKPPESDDYNFFLMGPNDWNDWAWLKTYEGRAMPGLVTGDGSAIVWADDANEVRTLNAKTGAEKGNFTVKDGEIHRLSLDRRDRLIAVIKLEEGGAVLRNYTSGGEKLWEFALPSAAFAIQPPAIDASDRVYLMIGDSLIVIDSGELRWKQPLPAGRTCYLTILGDNSVIVTGGIEIDQFDRDGKEMLSVELGDPNIITTPPVIDNKGRLYLGTAAGIYCLE